MTVSLVPGAAPKAESFPEPDSSPFFQKWTDPESGVESWILIQRVAPIQQSFYFTNPSYSDDGRFLWFYCSFPPGGDAYYGRQLAVLDFESHSLRHFPETQFADASPGVDRQSGEVYWTTGLEVFKRSADPDGTTTRVNGFPNELARNRRPLRLITHIGFSADKKAINVDAQIGTDWFVGDLPLDGGPFRLWQRFDRGYNHGQFSPTDPDLQLIAQDSWNDPTTGNYGAVVDRLWLIRRGEQAWPLCPDAPSNMRGHEWWDADGEHVWYIDYRNGTERVNIHNLKRENIWPGGHTHSHCDRAGKYLTGDISNAAHLDWRVAFFNRVTGREIKIVTSLPELSFPRSRYHTHPHPQFCNHDRWICYTTTVRGSVDVAMVSVEQLNSLTTK